jgi:hypothetical protein
MSNDIRDILERLAILEGRITPTTVKSGLNPQQKEVPQLPALFKPKHISVLTAKTDPEHPMHDYMVGDSVENDEEMVDESHMSNIDQIMQDIGTGEIDIYDIYAHPKTPEEEYASKIVNRMYDDVTINRGLHPDDQFEEILDIVADQIAQDYPADELNESLANEEKLLDKVKKSLSDYLTSVADQYKDDSIKKKAKDKDLGARAKDKDLVVKVEEDPTEEDPVVQAGTAPEVNPTYEEVACVKSITLEDGRICEIHGNEHTGFEIRHGNNRLKTRFKNIDEANMAIEMFRARQRKQDESQDYVEEK